MSYWERNPVYVVGAAETLLGVVPDHTELSMFALAAQEALSEAGMTFKDVDGIFVNYMGEEGSVQVGEYLGIFEPRNARKKPVRVLGAGESQTRRNLSQAADITVTPGVVSGREALGMAGISPQDVDFLQPYDSFTITVLTALEDLGFYEKGEGGAFVEGGRLAPGEALPAMTSGGGLSYNHPGALGVQLIIEAVRQLRGEAGARQLEGPKIGLVHGVGGLLSTAATTVLADD